LKGGSDMKMVLIGPLEHESYLMMVDDSSGDTNRNIYQCPVCKRIEIKEEFVEEEEAPDCACVENTPRKDIRVGIAADSKFVDLDAVVGQIKEDLATIEIIRKEAKELAEQWIKSAPNGVRTLSVPYAARLIIKAAKKGMTDDERLLWQEVLERC